LLINSTTKMTTQQKQKGYINLNGKEQEHQQKNRKTKEQQQHSKEQ